jgi:hypothetical protein
MKPKALMLSAAVLLGSTAVVFAQANSLPTVTPGGPTSGAMTQHINENPSPAAQPAAKAMAPNAAQSSAAQPTSTDKKQAQTQSPRTSKRRAMAARHVTPRSSERDRATTALNLLEEKGYRDFSTFRPAGRDYEITTKQSGKSVTVLVNPDTKSVQTQG